MISGMYLGEVVRLVLVKLGEKVRPETKRWLIRVIGAPQADGGEGSNISDELRESQRLIDCNPAKKNKHMKH